MKPSQVAGSLRHIASKIQNSKTPDRRLVAKDLRQVLAAATGHMTVGQLIALLGQQDPSAEVGVTMSDKHGWIETIRGLSKAPDGTIGIDIDSYSGTHLIDEVELAKI